MNNIIFSSGKFLIVDIIGDFLFWPVWWYTVGLRDMAKFVLKQIRDVWKSMALGLWIRNFFVPMYADRSILGRGISLVIRLIFLVWKSVWFVAWSIPSIVLLILWIVTPVGVIYLIIQQFRPDA
jgi:hypothetical protein